MISAPENAPLVQITLRNGAVVDVLEDEEGSARCAGPRCRHLQVQTALTEDGERWRCGLIDGPPPVPPHDFCEPRAIELAELLHHARLARRGGS